MSEEYFGNLAMHPGKEDDDFTPTAIPTESPPETALIQSLPAPDNLFSRIWLDANGLRPIWRLLLYLAMARVLFMVLGWPVAYIEQMNVNQLWLDLISEFVFLVAAFVPALILARPEGRSLGDYGFPTRQAFGKLFCIGGLWGIVAISSLMVTLRGAGVFSLGMLALHGSRILEFAAFWGVFFLLVAFAEEFLLRGYSQFTFAQAIGFWPSAVVLSITFGAIHLWNPGETWTGGLAAVAIGLFFCLSLRRTGSLWFAVGFHSAWDWCESFLYSVPDSGQVAPRHLLKSSLHGSHWLTGGSVGPEGSILIFVLLTLLWLIFDRIYPRDVCVPSSC